MTRLGFAKVFKFPKTASFVLVMWQGISGLAILPRPQHPSENQHRTWNLLISKFGISCIPGRTLPPHIFRFHVSFLGGPRITCFFPPFVVPDHSFEASWSALDLQFPAASTRGLDQPGDGMPASLPWSLVWKGSWNMKNDGWYEWYVTIR